MSRRILLLVILALLLAKQAHCEEYNKQNHYFFRYGVGVFESAAGSPTETHILSVGAQFPLTKYFMWQIEGGGWNDVRSDMGRQSSFFFSPSLGLDLDFHPFYVQALIGPALITTPDVYLGGNFQFTEELGFGIKDRRGVGIGLSYKHFSSAGIENPNVGRDFMTLKVFVPGFW